MALSTFKQLPQCLQRKSLTLVMMLQHIWDWKLFLSTVLSRFFRSGSSSLAPGTSTHPRHVRNWANPRHVGRQDACSSLLGLSCPMAQFPDGAVEATAAWLLFCLPPLQPSSSPAMGSYAVDSGSLECAPWAEGGGEASLAPSLQPSGTTAEPQVDAQNPDSCLATGGHVWVALLTAAAPQSHTAAVLGV